MEFWKTITQVVWGYSTTRTESMKEGSSKTGSSMALEEQHGKKVMFTMVCSIKDA